MAIQTPTDRRFHRARIWPRRRAAWRGRLLAALKLACVAGVVGYGSVRGSDLLSEMRVLRVDEVLVEGRQRLSPGEVQALLDGLRGRNLLRVDLPAARRRLLASPWIEDATLRRILPSTVEVQIVERQPVAIGRLGEHELYLIDAGGVVIDEYGPRYADVDLPIVDGLGADGAPGAVSPARAALAARMLAALERDPRVAGRVSQVDVSDPHNAVALLEGDAALVHLGDDRFLERLRSYLEIAPALYATVPAIESVDLRFDRRVFLRPAAADPSRRRGRSR